MYTFETLQSCLNLVCIIPQREGKTNSTISYRPRDKSDQRKRQASNQEDFPDIQSKISSVQVQELRMAPQVFVNLTECNMICNVSLSQELSVIRIPPYHYIHVLDQTTNVTRLEVGPATFVRKDNEMVVSGVETWREHIYRLCGMIDTELISGPQRMITVPPRHYCLVVNPVMRGQDGQVLLDNVGQVVLKK